MADATPLGLSSVSSMFACKGILCAIASGNNIYAYSFATASWTQIGGPGSFFCSDGFSIWGGTALGGVWLFASPGEWQEVYPSTANPVSRIAASNNVLYVLEEDGLFVTVYTVSGTTVAQYYKAPIGSAVLVSNETAAYICTPLSCSQVVNGAMTQIYPPQSPNSFISFKTQTILTDGSEILILGSDGNFYAYDSPSGQSIGSVPAYPDPSASYAYARPWLVACADNNVYYFDPGSGGWIQFNVGGPPVASIYGGGVVPFSIDTSGNAYTLVPAQALSAERSFAVRPSKLPILLAAPPNPQTWMTDLRQSNPKFGSLRLSQVCIPGSHDSGCYDFPLIEQLKSVTDLATTQTLDITGQLNAGARFFDIRPLPDVSAGIFYIYHGDIETNVKLVDALNMFKAFAIANPGELLFIYINHQDPAQITLVSKLILGMFPSSMVYAGSAVSPSNVTYDILVNNGQNILLFSDNSSPGGAFQFNTIADLCAYANTDVPDSLISFINDELSKNANITATRGWMLQCQLTPSVFDSLASIAAQLTGNSSGPLELASDSIGPVQDRLNPQQNPDAAASLNFFIVDAYDQSWTSLAYAINLTRV